MFDNRKVDDKVRQQLWDKYYTKLSKGVDVGYSPEAAFYDAELVHSLKHNVALFSAFKEASFERTLASLLESGKLPTFVEFREEALKTSQLYNGNWLKSEYDHTVATARMAQKWQDFQRNKDVYPNLEYVAVLDDRVRDKHRSLHGTVAPLHHPIWKKILPPSDWGCRCNVIQTDAPVSKHIPEIDIKRAFQNNAALSGKIFNEILYANGLSDKALRNATANALRWLHAKVEDKTFKRYLEQAIYLLPRSSQFVELERFGKGRVLEHILVDRLSDDYGEIMEAAVGFARLGRVTEIMPELVGRDKLKFRGKVFPKYQRTNNPDLRVDGVLMDLKRPKVIRNIVGLANSAAHKQHVIAVLHCGGLNIDMKILERRAIDILSEKNPFYTFDKVYFFYKGRIIEFP